ncbi:MAG TPA: DUF1592 domain-containing protein [Pirellulales bacterium]|jgi:hypothetical protein|nr:DUF1592 domain-containing protein [Pirellulales bacterium]
MRPLCLFACAWIYSSLAHAAAPAPARFDATQRAFFKDYCVECHGAETQEGQLRLDDISLAIETVEQADRWQKILGALNSGEMPPEDAKQPNPERKTEFLDKLSNTLARARKIIGDDGGRITLRRLNQREYKNTLRELLGVEIDVRDLPTDGGTGTFDTVGASLYMSSDQIEQHLALGRRALDEHFARASTSQPKQFRAREEAEIEGNKLMNGLFKRTQEQHDNYVRWTASVDEAAKLPENLVIAAKLRKDAEKPRPSSGVPYATPMFFYLDAEQIHGAPSPTEFGFQDAQNAFFEEIQYRKFFSYYADYQKLPGRDAGAWLLFYHGYRETYVAAGEKWPAGRYTLRLRVAANDAAPKERRFVEVGQRGNDVSDFTVLSAHQVTGTLEQPQVIELSVDVRTSGKREFAVREKRPNSRQAEIRTYHDEVEKTGHGPVPAIWIDWFEIEGPQASQQPAVSLVAASQDSAAARGVIERASTKPQKLCKAREEAELEGNRRMDNLFKRTKEMHDNFVRWTTAVDEAAKRPENVPIAEQLRNDAKKSPALSANPRARPLLFYHDWDKIAGAPSPMGFGFQDSQAALFEELRYRLHFSYYADYQQLPGRDTGAWLLFYLAYRETYVSAGDEWPAGRYTLRMRVAANDAAPPERHFVEVGQRGDNTSDFTVFSAHQVTGTLEQPQVIELSVDVRTGGKREFAVREKRPNSHKAEIHSYVSEFDKTGHGPAPAIWIDWFEIEGPQASQQPTAASLAPPTQDIAGARAVVERFATRAFRGVTPSADYLDRLMALFETRRSAGDSFDEALKEPLSVVLASPSFLYLCEPSADAGHRRLNGFELASRLSYFLWSGPPDDELLALAGSDALQSPAVLAAQVDRMIADDRSSQFASGFTEQWLGMARLDFFQFDFQLHRGFDDSAKAAAREEVYQTVGCLLRENLSLRRLLKSDFVVINGLLANYYGLEGVHGDRFRKVSLPAESPRGGLLGMAAILAMGSNGQYTSPVERGAWVLRKLLHDPPPPAPPNVPQLARLEGKVLSVRERLKAHQEEPQCANCHRKIDPIGFGLENFDAAGKWRLEDTYQLKGGAKKTWPVDPAAALHKGPAFKDYFELREIVESKSDAFARGFTEALIEYALGRPFGFTDDDLATSIVNRARANDFAMREFIQALVASEPFHSK